MITFETIAYVCFSCDVTKSNRNQKGIKSTLYIGVFCLHEYLFSIINPTLIWELIKSDIRGYAIKYSSEDEKQETELIKDKEREHNTLEALQESLNYTDQHIENNLLTILYENEFITNFLMFFQNIL
jgi:hypothetical protein